MSRSAAEVMLVGYWEVGADGEFHSPSAAFATWQQVAAWCHGSMAYARARREYVDAEMFGAARDLAHARAKAAL